MPMTMRQILASTPPSRRSASEWVKIIGLKVRKSPEGYPLVLAQTIATNYPDGRRKIPQPTHRYVSTIEVRRQYVIVSCSCDDFKYTFEYALNKRGAAKIEYSNGEPPVERNPKLVPGVCKHLFALGKKLIETGKL